MLTDQPTATPTPKLIASGVSGVLTAGLVALAQRYGLQLPPLVAEAVVLLAAWAAGYIKRDRRVAAVLAEVEHLAQQVAPVVTPAPAPAVGAVREVGPLYPPTAPVAAVRGPQT